MVFSSVTPARMVPVDQDGDVEEEQPGVRHRSPRVVTGLGPAEGRGLQRVRRHDFDHVGRHIALFGDDGLELDRCCPLLEEAGDLGLAKTANAFDDQLRAVDQDGVELALVEADLGCLTTLESGTSMATEGSASGSSVAFPSCSAAVMIGSLPSPIDSHLDSSGPPPITSGTTTRAVTRTSVTPRRDEERLRSSVLAIHA